MFVVGLAQIPRNQMQALIGLDVEVQVIKLAWGGGPTRRRPNCILVH
tara:strand:- start:459 stop:599 length:141 start_codon:yes stop_codon:yes gene_type:complete